MAKILHIESSTLTCSVAVAINGICTAKKESHDKSYAHSENLVKYIDDVLKTADLTTKDLDAVCVAKGPGSYTGLRIGVSAAKGLCYGLGIPLLSIGTLESMAAWALRNHSKNIETHAMLCPMIDARRMEVYTQLFGTDVNQIDPISAQIVEENSFQTPLATGPVVFFGDGAAKCRSLMNHENAVFLDDFAPSAEGMIALAEQKLQNGAYEDVAYFEPYYLKDFVAGKPKKIF